MPDGKMALIDTSILIPFYNRGGFQDSLLHLNSEYSLFFSAASINEFIRGAHDKVSKAIIDDLINIVGENLITPSKNQWIECGRVSEKILRHKRRSKDKILILQNDILIALSARDMKAKLITADKKDFNLIGDYMELDIEYWL